MFINKDLYLRRVVLVTENDIQDIRGTLADVLFILLQLDRDIWEAQWHHKSEPYQSPLDSENDETRKFMID